MVSCLRARIADPERCPGRLTGVAGGMQIILPAQLREACGAEAEPAQFGRQGCRCHSFGWCHVFNGEAPRGEERSCGSSSPSDGGTEADTAVSCGEEDVMSDTTPALDEAYERIAAASFELPNGFVNHGAMAVKRWPYWTALATSTAGHAGSPRRAARGSHWWRRPALSGGKPSALRPSPGVDRVLRAGHYDRGWRGGRDVGASPTPALRTALFHGAIRTAHAVRAIDAVDTPPRREELARALGYWAARYLPASLPGRKAPPVTPGLPSSAPRPTAPAATWPGPTSSICTASPARWPWRSSSAISGHRGHRRLGPGACRTRGAVRRR